MKNEDLAKVLQKLVIRNFIEKFKTGGKIKIDPANKGKFTRSAKQAGESIQEHAKNVMKNPNSTTLQKRRANFAIQSKKWNKK